ncbi:MAG: (d)CMP kinase [Paracoccaceae bacterium]|tara:strand:+ start:148 stop:777 length:630 start_codon:yes stop_codon:yes gene_type:complete
MGLVLAVDGPGGAGKGTICHIASKILGYPYLDTGLLYRAVALKLVAKNIANIESHAIEFAGDLKLEDLNKAGLREPEVSNLSSKVAIIPEVRERLLSFQTEFSRDARGAILDGRDIGARVCPNADIKFYITASLEVRAKRRWIETIKLNPSETLSKVKADLMKRDTRDRSRSLAPLIKAEDALLIDTSELTIDASVKLFIEAVKEKLNN